MRHGRARATGDPARTLAVLAGDRYPHDRIAGRVNRALLVFGGRTALARVLRAAADSGAFDRVIVVGPSSLDTAVATARVALPVRRVAQGDSMVDNLRRAFDAAGVGPDERLVVTAADIPLVMPHELARFAAWVRRSPADVCVAFARPDPDGPRGALLDVYRGTLMIARGGPYLLGNLFGVRRSVLEFAEVIERARRVRGQSRAANVHRALRLLVALGAPALRALVTWRRLVAARALWLRRGVYDRIPAIAPEPARIAAATAALARGRLSVEFADIGGEGACYDVDTVSEYEAVRALCERPAGHGAASVRA